MVMGVRAERGTDSKGPVGLARTQEHEHFWRQKPARIVRFLTPEQEEEGPVGPSSQISTDSGSLDRFGNLFFVLLLADRRQPLGRVERQIIIRRTLREIAEDPKR